MNEYQIRHKVLETLLSKFKTINIPNVPIDPNFQYERISLTKKEIAQKINTSKSDLFPELIYLLEEEEIKSLSESEDNYYITRKGGRNYAGKKYLKEAEQQSSASFQRKVKDIYAPVTLIAAILGIIGWFWSNSSNPNHKLDNEIVASLDKNVKNEQQIQTEETTKIDEKEAKPEKPTEPKPTNTPTKKITKKIVNVPYLNNFLKTQYPNFTFDDDANAKYTISFSSSSEIRKSNYSKNRYLYGGGHLIINLNGGEKCKELNGIKIPRYPSKYGNAKSNVETALQNSIKTIVLNNKDSISKSIIQCIK